MRQCISILFFTLYSALALHAQDVAVHILGPATVNHNGTLSYKIMVSNYGSTSLSNVTVSSPAISGFNATAISCTAGQGVSGAASCPGTSTVSALEAGTLTIPSLPRISNVTFVLTGTATGAIGSTLNKTVTVTTATGVTDVATSNNTASAATLITNSVTTGSQSVYTMDLTWMAANNSVAANGGNLTMRYTLTSGTAVTGIGNFFDITLQYSDLLNTASSSDHQWNAIGVNGSSPYTPGFAFCPATATGTAGAAQTGSIYNGRPTNNNKAAGQPIPPYATGGFGSMQYTRSDTNFTYWLRNNQLDPIGTFNFTVGSLPATPAGYILLSKSFTLSGSGNIAERNVSPFIAAGWRVKPIDQPAIFPFSGATPPNSQLPVEVPYGSVYTYGYSAFADPNSLYFAANGGNNRGAIVNGSVTFQSLSTLIVSGNVWNDADGNLALNGTEAGTNGGGPLYVNLVDDNGNVVTSATVAADGTYTLNGVPVSVTGYKLVLTSTSTGTTPGTLPTGYVNTGENVGSGNTATQSTTVGQIELNTSTNNIAAQNFGIEQLPTPGSGTATVANNGGTSPVTVPPTAFTSTTPSTDTAPGSVTAIRITTFPSNVTSLTINGTVYTASSTAFTSGTGVVVPTTGSGAPTVPILVDPTNDSNPVVFTYTAIDNAGKASTTTGTATINSSLLTSVSGSVWNDADGSVTLNGSENGTNAGGTLYVNLVDATNTIIASTTVSPTGSYTLTGVPANTSGLKLVLTNTSSSTTPGGLPTGWVNTGENVDPSNTATQSTTVGQIELTTGTSAVTAQNFGIEQLPTSGSGSNTVANAGGTTPVTVPANTFTNSTPSTDTAPGSVTAIRITALPSNTTSLTVNGSVYNSGNFPGQGITVPTDGSGNPTVPIAVDPTNDANPVVIPFVAVDNAGKASTTTGTATINSTPLASLSGNVFDDANGLTDNTVNGTAVNGPSLPLYISLVQAGTVVATVPLQTDGTYSFTSVSPGSYSLVLTTSAGGSSTPSLPASWSSTGENLGTGAVSDGAPNGVLAVTLGGSSLSEANFGIDRLPTANPVSQTYTNPGGTLEVQVPTLTGSDPEDGTYNGTSLTNTVVIQSLPASTTSGGSSGILYYNGSAVSAGTVISNYDPSLLTYDPVDGPGSYTFAYSEVDAAGLASLTATATMSFTVAVPDLAPIIYALPATQYNTTNTTVVVDVFELNNVATSGLITVAISKDPLVSLNFNPAATFVGGRPVNNSIWTFNNTNPNFYIFTTTQVIDAGDVKSIGMTGVTTPGNTQGVLTLSTTIVGGSGGESRIDNNSDADKIDYFKK